MFLKKIKLSKIALKIGLLGVILIVLSLAIFSSVLIISERNGISSDILKTGMTFADLSSQAIYTEYLADYPVANLPTVFDTMKTRLGGILSNDTDITSLTLIGLNGKILFDSTTEFKDGLYSGPGRFITDQTVLDLVKKNTDSYRKVTTADDKEVIEIYTPVLEITGDHYVSVKFILSENSLNARMAAIYSQIFLVFAIVLLVSILLTIPFSLNFAKPIVKLKDLTRKISDGDLDTEIKITSKDELGELAMSFNVMTASLKKSRVKLEDYARSLEDERARLLASINSLSFGFALVNMRDELILSNRSLSKILEVEKSPLNMVELGKYFKEFNIIGTCKLCITTNKIVEMKEVLYNPKKFLRVFCTPIVSENETIGYVIIMEDITEQKILERSKDEFFAVASHELRTPLTAIRGNTEMIMSLYADKVQDQDVREMISDIESASVRLIGIVNDFLEISRLEQGNIIVKKTNFDLVKVVKKVMDSTKLLIAAKKVELKFEEPESIPQVFADEERTEQVLFNLLGNAAKFTQEGRIEIFVSVDNGFVKVRVADTGSGISDQGTNLLFRKFQPAGDQSLARDVSKSTGLGLYISKMLTEKMGGTIGLEKTQLGMGSVFFFTLPVAS